jgi:hypothetical protein
MGRRSRARRTNPTLLYGDVMVTCDSGSIAGATGIASDIVDFDVEFQEPCDVNGLYATVECSGTARWHVLTASSGEIDRLNPDFRCDVIVSGICTITVLEQDLPTGPNNRADPFQGRRLSSTWT